MTPVFEKLTDRQLSVWEESTFAELAEAAHHIRECYAQGIRGADWKSIDTAPDQGVFLVCLDKPMLGSYVQVMRRYKGPNGTMAFIGGLFGFDCPAPTLWMPIDFPQGKEPK